MALDKDDLAAIAALVKEETKGFLTPEAASKMVAQSLGDTLKASGLDTLGDTLKGLNSEIEALKKGGAGDKGGNGGDDKGGDKGTKGDAEAEAKLAKLNEQLAEAEERQRKSEEAREAAEAREQQNKVHAAVRDALIENGLDPAKVSLAMPNVLGMKTEKGEPVVGLDAQGDVVWREQKTGYVETVKLSEGAAAWAQTDAGKTFMPPKSVEHPNRGPGGGRGVPKTESGSTDFGALLGRVNLSGALS